MTTNNAFEYRARQAKVARLLAVVPCGRNRREIDATAAWLESLTGAERAILATHAGVHVPSAETWAALVRAAFNRASMEEVA